MKHIKDSAFPKYTSQLINLANQNAQGTRPSNVGQISDLFQEFLRESDDPSVENWEAWYEKRNPEAIKSATKKICAQVQNLAAALMEIDNDLVERWVRDLLIQKSFAGLNIQKKILESIAEKEHLPYRLATKEEEGRGIDGYVGGVPYSIKPESYKTMERLPETIPVKIIYYSITQDGFTFSE